MANFHPGDRVIIHLPLGTDPALSDWEGIVGEVITCPIGSFSQHVAFMPDSNVRGWGHRWAILELSWVHPLEADTPFLADLREYITKEKAALCA